MSENMNHRIFWGNILRKLRYDHNLTQDEVAEMLHMTRQRYSNYECGKRHPSPELIAIISDLYDVDLNKYVIDLMPKNYVAEHNNYKVHIRKIRKKGKKRKPADDSDDDLLIIED